jgi:hypothetical protein
MKLPHHSCGTKYRKHEKEKRKEEEPLNSSHDSFRETKGNGI